MMSRNVGRRIAKKKQKQMMIILMTLVSSEGALIAIAPYA